jgi:acetyl esterase/lipase
MALAFSVFRLLLSALLFGMSLLAVAPLPVATLWKPAVAAIEWGPALAAVCAVLVFSAVVDTRLSTAFAFATAGGALFLSPTLRASFAAGDIASAYVAVFGARTADLADPRPEPFSWRAVVGRRPDAVDVTTHTYTPGPAPLELDLYRQGEGVRPVIVAVHGGSWRSGDRHQLAAIYRYFAARGWAVATVDHTLAPKAQFPAQKTDVVAAVRWLQQHADELGIDPRRVVLYGRSSGAHLALLTAYASDLSGIRGVVAWYPPTDLLWSWENPGSRLIIDTQGILFDLMDGPPGDDPALYAQANVVGHASRQSPPTLLIHGTRDELVDVEQSRRLDRRLSELGVQHLLVELPWATHGCDANLGGPSGQIGLWLIERFLGHVGRVPGG